MKCPNCRLTEMIVEKIFDNKVKHYCRNCGTTEITDMPKENVSSKSI